jgi:hypothetical protein
MEMSDTSLDGKRAMLRHAVATLAYRGGKAVRDAPAGFEESRVSASSRTPGEILAHVGDLLDWALSLAQGSPAWHDSGALPWAYGVGRFFQTLQGLDTHLASGAPLGSTAEEIFQGPIADALTHVGQIAMLRRIAGSPVRGENYARAEIVAGRVGPEQPGKRFEFD